MLLTRMILAACLTFFTAHFFAFIHGDLSGVKGLRKESYEAAVVFTGAYDRIDHALDLLQGGAVPHVFISGANPNAGIWLDRFTAQFGRGSAELSRLIACCVTFGEAAETTLQNAAETACWLRGRNLRGAVALVTSWDHMPRAHVALAGLIGASRITATPVGGPADEDAPDARRLVQEYLKLWGVRLVNWAPRALTAGSFGPFREGCPRGGT